MGGIFQQVNKSPISHLGIIMDGNGRWAKEKGWPRLEGHRRGAQRARDIINAVFKRGISYLTLYAFSSENWKRAPEEISGLMQLLSFFLEKYVGKLLQEGVCLHCLGDWKALPESVAKALDGAIKRTQEAGPYHLCLALNYGARDEVLRAVQHYATDCLKKGSLDASLDWSQFSDYLFTAGMPDPDLIIRTSGEQRLSNFLLLQAAYSELYFTPIYWPDFGEQELEKALASFQERCRRYGS